MSAWILSNYGFWHHTFVSLYHENDFYLDKSIDENRNKKNAYLFYNHLKKKNIENKDRNDFSLSAVTAIDKIFNFTSVLHLVLVNKNKKLPVVLPKVLLKEIHSYIDFSLPKNYLVG